MIEEETMSVDATIHYKDGTQERKLMEGWEEFCVWLIKHGNEYDGFEAHTVKAEDMRQGREP